MSLALLFHFLLLNMFRMLVHPSSGACDLLWIYFMCCIALVRCVLVLRCGSAGFCVISLCRLRQSHWTGPLQGLRVPLCWYSFWVRVSFVDRAAILILPCAYVLATGAAPSAASVLMHCRHCRQLRHSFLPNFPTAFIDPQQFPMYMFMDFKWKACGV